MCYKDEVQRRNAEKLQKKFDEDNTPGFIQIAMNFVICQVIMYFIVWITIFHDCCNCKSLYHINSSIFCIKKASGYLFSKCFAFVYYLILDEYEERLKKITEE